MPSVTILSRTAPEQWPTNSCRTASWRGNTCLYQRQRYRSRNDSRVLELFTVVESQPVGNVIHKSGARPLVNPLESKGAYSATSNNMIIRTRQHVLVESTCIRFTGRPKKGWCYATSALNAIFRPYSGHVKRHPQRQHAFQT